MNGSTRGEGAKAGAFTCQGHIHLHLNSNDLLLRKFSFKETVHLIIGGLRRNLSEKQDEKKQTGCS